MWIRAALLLLAMAGAAAEPDFTGVWKLAASKSDFAKVAPPQSQEIRVRKDGNLLRVESKLVDERGTSTYAYAIDPSGKPVENTIRGLRVESTASWRGPMLHVKSKTTIQDSEIKSVDQWQLGEGGKELTIYRSATTPKGDVEQRYVYEKVSGGS